MTENEKLKQLAKDLAKDYPRSPRETLAGYVIAARMLDKCRAVIVGTAGEYHFDCRLDNEFLGFAGVDAGQFKTLVATGATDDQVASWISTRATPRPLLAIITTNNRI